jgi:hypothetical protein
MTPDGARGRAAAAPEEPAAAPPEWEWQKTEMQNEQRVLKEANEVLKSVNDRLMVMPGLGRVVALHQRSSTSYQSR